MQTTNDNRCETNSEASFDTLTSGLSFTLVTNIVQRGVGFVRNVALCHFLSDGKLGLWALASAFFVLAAPLSVFGLPGCFGKFVEYYRVRGQLSGFLRKTSIGAGIGCAAFFLLLAVGWQQSSRIIFGESLSFQAMLVIAVTLVVVTIFNFVVELYSGLRQPKTVSSMLFVNSIAFTILAIGICAIWPDWIGLVIAFGLSAIVGLVPAIRKPITHHATQEEADATASQESMWRRILPYALSIWMMNLLVNLFEVVDRYMLLYFAGDQGDVGHRLIGQFHSARLLPVLLFSLASAVGSMLLPYLSAELEKSRLDVVASKTIATIKFSALGFMGFAILAMAASPFLFQVLWKERFELGQEVMPLAMVTVLWSAIALIAQNYLWCVEKTRAVTISLAVGLVVNIALNWILIPVWGLHGAVWATMLATALNLVLILYAVHRAGCTLDRALWIICTLPILLGISTTAAAVGLAGVIVIAGRTNLLLSVTEQQTIEDLLRPALSKLRWQHACFTTSR